MNDAELQSNEALKGRCVLVHLNYIQGVIWKDVKAKLQHLKNNENWRVATLLIVRLI